MSNLSNPKFELTNAEESVLSSLGLLNDTPDGSALVKEDGLIKNRVMSGGSSVTLKTDGVDNGSQSILNLKAGTNLNLTDDGLGGITIDAIGDGMGDVTGPASSTNNNVVLFDGTTGKIIKDSGLQLTGSNTGDVTVTDSSEIDFTLTGQDITASLKTGSIDETKLDTSVNTSLGLANTAVQPAAIANFETTTQLNTRDTNNRNRANHTGTQTASTISDIQETVEDIIGAKVIAGTNVTVSYNDTTGETTISSTGGGGGSYTFNDGLTESAGVVKLGGTLSSTRTITTGGNKVTLTGASSNSDLRLSAIANSGLSGNNLYKLYTGGSYLRGSMVFDSLGNVYVAEAVSGVIRKITPTGTATTFVTCATGIQGLAIDSAGNIYGGSQSTGNVYKITPGGTITTFVTLSGATSTWGITIDNKNNIFVLGYNNGIIYKVTPTGNQSTFATGFTYGHDLAADSKGNIYCATFSNTIARVGSNGGTSSVFASGLVNPAGLAIDSSDNIYLTENDNFKVSVYNTSGVRQDILTFSSAPLQGIAVSPSGDILVSDCVASAGSSLYNISQTQVKVLKTDSNGDVVKSTTGEQTGIKGVPKLILPSDGVQFSDTFFKFPTQEKPTNEWNMTESTDGIWEGTVGQAEGIFSNSLPTTTSRHTAQKRASYTNEATTTDQVLGQRNTEAMFFRGSTAGQGGFFFYARFGIGTWTSSSRLFIGMHIDTTTISANPSSSLDILGFGVDSGDSSITFMSNDGSGTATKTAISGQPSLASNQGYEAYIYCMPNDTAVYYRLDDYNTGTVIVNSKINTNLPTATTMMTAGCLASNASLTTADTVKIEVSKIYIAPNI